MSRLVWLTGAELNEWPARLLPCPWCGRRGRMLLDRWSLYAGCQLRRSKTCQLAPKAGPMAINYGPHPELGTSCAYVSLESLEFLLSAWNSRTLTPA